MTDTDSSGASTLGRFRAGLERHGVSVTDAEPGSLAAAVEGAVEPPAVGAPLPFDGLSLPDSIPTDPTPAALDAARTGVTAARLGVADYGSVALASTPDGTEPVALFPERHVVVLRAADVVPGMRAALAELGERAREDTRSHVLATGPSATADMGGLVYGAHGPEEVHLVLVGNAGGSAT
ncbi:MAG: LUD domain-containing protein [Haloferacaceae archaeon]